MRKVQSEWRAPTRQQLTKTAVDRLKPGERVWDTAVRGFGVRRQTRDPIFVLRYRHQRRERWITIGIHGAPWTVDKARKEAQRLLGIVAEGFDPAIDRDRERSAPTVTELANQFLERHARVKLKRGTATNYGYQINCTVIPELGAHRTEAVCHADIEKLHAKMAAKPYEANRVLALLSKMFNWAELNGYRVKGTNPCPGVEKYRESRRERFLNDAELGRLGDVLADCEADHTEAPWTIAAIRLLIFTGARSNEIASLRWEYVDEQRAFLLLPDSKTGRKVIHLNVPALAVLRDIQWVPDNPYVVVGLKAGHHATDLGHRWRRIRKLAELSDVRLHDLRHSYASVAGAHGGSLPMIGKLLGHSNPTTTNRYLHLVADPIRALNEQAGTKLAAALKSKRSA